MNIKFGMNNFYTRYLKRFLNYHLVRTSSVLGDFNVDDLRLLIKYLNYPNTETIFETEKKVIQEFPELSRYFIITMQTTEIVFTAKTISVEISNFLQNNLDTINNFCKKLGWEIGTISNWMDINYDINSDGRIDETDRRILNDIVNNGAIYSDDIMKKADLNLDGFRNHDDIVLLEEYMNSHKIAFTIRSEGRNNIFPNKDMLIFINQFEGDFLYNYAIRDNNGYTDIIHKSEPNRITDIGTKVGLYKCTPNQKITIAHDSTSTAHLVIGCSSEVQRKNVTSLMLTDVVEIDLKPGESYQYTTTPIDEETGIGAQWVCIQCPADYSNISGHSNKTVLLDVGDINFDGRIDMEDYNILAQYTAEGAGADKLPLNKANWTPTEKQLAVMNCRTDTEYHRNHINTDDAVLLYNYINNIGGITDLGLVPWTVDTNDYYEESKNVGNLLIIDGHYNQNVNIPFNEFTKDPWVIHDKFFNYLFNMAIHKFSNSEDITYVQKLLTEVYPESVYNNNFFTLGTFNDDMKQKMKAYQESKINYIVGDLNKDNKIDEKDLVIMRKYVDDCADYTKVCKYLIDPVKNALSKTEIETIDRDGDNFITENDKQILEAEINEKYAPTIRDRADIDRNGLIEEADYKYLKEIVENGHTYIEKEVLQEDGSYKTMYEYCDLKNYEISFQLGWLDVQTEAILEKDVNIYGDISEVTK